MEKGLSFLQDLSSRLNEESDSISETLHVFQTKLNKLNLGLEVWLTLPIKELQRTGSSILTSSFVVSEELRLGYGKTKKGWGLCVKKVKIESGYYEGNRECPVSEHFDLSEPVSLFDSSREVRLEAIRLLPQLIVMLKEKAETILRDIQSLKEIAETL